MNPMNKVLLLALMPALLLTQTNISCGGQGVSMTFVDAFGESHEADVHPDWPLRDVVNDCFARNGEICTYEDGNYTSRVGIDISKYQSQVDFAKVKEAGYEFVIIRLGFRGYTGGDLNTDKMFASHIRGAMEAGLDVGVYFFSQAINEEEARAEADYCAKQLENQGITPDMLKMPVVYDPESILFADSRTDDVSGEQFTSNCVAFCDRILEYGYDTMIYSNMKWEAYELDLSQLSAYDLWYADYEALPQTPYRFIMWQYSQTGDVPGVSGACDLDIQLVPKSMNPEEGKTDRKNK